MFIIIWVWVLYLTVKYILQKVLFLNHPSYRNKTEKH